MIDWLQVLMITASGIVGGELGQRWAIEEGRLIILQPVWSYRLLCWLTAFGMVMFVETARVALKAPSEQGVWFLVGASVGLLAVAALMLSLELHFAKREIKRLRSSS